MKKWIACHDTLVCSGAKSIQKWCVREGDEKGALVAVMLTREVADMLAASPELIASLHHAMAFLDSLPKGWLGKTSGDIAELNDFYLTAKPALAKAGIKMLKKSA